MNKRIKRLLLAALVVVALLVVADVTLAQTGLSRQSFEWIVAKRVSVDSDLSVGDDLTVADDAAISGAATVGETLGVTGASTFTGRGTMSTFFNTTAGTSITVTDNLELVPVAAYQPIAAADNVGTDSITTTGFIAGDWVTFVNTSDTTITITDTGTVMLSGNAALGQYDTLSLLFDGANWLEVAQTNN